MSNLLILIIDTAHPIARVILADGEKILATREWVNTPKVGTDLLACVEEVLQEVGKRKEDLTRVGVHAGPGSYGLVRTGIVTATILSRAVGAHLVEVEGETIEVLVESARKAEPIESIQAHFRE